MRQCFRLLSSWKFLPNRDRILFKNKREAFRDYWRITGASFLFHIAYAIVIAEFAFPTYDIIYDIKRKISPDFDLFCQYGDKAEYRLELSNRIRSLQREQERLEYERATVKPPEARFGGAI
ncbi:unnamed protein product [Strongylus vulgaris]|uniref:Uncharacterized protein n=1 Tax=Strongylus vulgaris TaxID=40348 RepID=A0A3P7IM98_STRVU|nr:unnamed protein product [Strongylus vulgaris]